jgi:hypothetical protein
MPTLLAAKLLRVDEAPPKVFGPMRQIRVQFRTRVAEEGRRDFGVVVAKIDRLATAARAGRRRIGGHGVETVPDRLVVLECIVKV